MNEYIEMDDRLFRLSCLAETMSAIEDAMVNGENEVSGDAWLIPLSEMRRLSSELSVLLNTCIERERESKQQPVMAR